MYVGVGEKFIWKMIGRQEKAYRRKWTFKEKFVRFFKP